MSHSQTADLSVTETAVGKLTKKQQIETVDLCDSSETEPSKRDPIVQSSWAYIKWFVWTLISGLFSCGVTVFEAAFDYHRPVTNSLVSTADSEAPVAPSAEHVVLTAIEETPLNYAEVLGQTFPTECSQPDQIEKCDSESLARETCLVHSPINGLFHTQLEESLTSFSAPKWHTEDLFSDCLSQADYSEQSTTPPTSFTLLNSYYANSKNGIIDEATCEKFVSEVLSSVIPRNLSDSSEVSVSPAVRKMYAWTDPEIELTEQHLVKQVSDEQSCGSDVQFAYPGKLTMSETSFSPLSPATAESNTPTGEISQTPSDLGLPDIDRQDQTLAWAMSNLSVNQGLMPGGGAGVDQIDLPVYDPAEPRILPERPPTLPVARERQSRERSPVSTINSARLQDTLSLPTFVPFEGGQMFNKTTDSEPVFEQPKPKRSSSLKSQRTPPGTPGQKAVRFADAFGLDLATVRHVFDLENPPKIPASATFDLQLDSDECIAKLGAKQFGLCFAQPGAASNFIRRVLNETVCLEDCHVDMPRGVLTGTIRVKSLGYEKHIAVRITYNNWVTFFDTQASYVQGSHDGATDRFSFSIVFPDTMVPGDRAQFAIRYDTHTGQQFWDNNHGQNYSVTCYAKATDLAGDGSWVHYL